VVSTRLIMRQGVVGPRLILRPALLLLLRTASATWARTLATGPAVIHPRVRPGAVTLGAAASRYAGKGGGGGGRGGGGGKGGGGGGKHGGLKAKQSLGQNFLTDVALARSIAKSVEGSPDDAAGSRVYELGPGQGAITGHLLERFPEMTAVEIDERMVDHLTSTMPDLQLEHADLLRLDFGALAAETGGQLSLVSNTPFYLTSPLLFKLLASTEHVHEAVLTMQREVAEKVLSPPSSKQYGVLSVMLQLFARPQSLFDLPPEAFEPAPKVWSSVLRFEPSPVPAGEQEPLTPTQRATVLGLCKLTFEHRRKMLRVSLRRLLEVGEQTGAVRRPPDHFLTMRPEQLAPAQWLELARSIFGDSLGDDGSSAAAEGGVAEADAPVLILQRAAVNKAWKAHKAGYKDKDKE
jgi:16S rRNA (adenine1518-N6/adenine1519-N6)-dimethyltransferase